VVEGARRRGGGVGRVIWIGKPGVYSLPRLVVARGESSGWACARGCGRCGVGGGGVDWSGERRRAMSRGACWT